MHALVENDVLNIRDVIVKLRDCDFLEELVPDFLLGLNLEGYKILG